MVCFRNLDIKIRRNGTKEKKDNRGKIVEILFGDDDDVSIIKASFPKVQKSWRNYFNY